MISVILSLVILGVIMFVVNSVVPMVPWMRTVVNAFVAILVIVWIARIFGVAPYHWRY